jgi:hypothetical protein
MMKQLSTIDKRKYEVQLVGVLECKLERRDEGIIDLSEHGSLCQGVRHLTTRDDVGLSDCLESVDSPGIVLADLHDLRVRRT